MKVSTSSRFVACFCACLAVALPAIACQSEPSQTTTSPTTTATTTTPTTSAYSSALTTFTSDDFSGSGNCAVCHSNLTDANGDDVSVDSHWRSTMMANAATDPYWQASVASELAHNPALADAINDACALCHMPMARTQAVTNGTAVAIFGDGF
jgi:hypothetical protein